MKELKQIKCAACGKEVQVTKHGKVAPHNKGAVRCGRSGSRVVTTEKKNG